MSVNIILFSVYSVVKVPVICGSNSEFFGSVGEYLLLNSMVISRDDFHLPIKLGHDSTDIGNARKRKIAIRFM
jgi:hypothetical protein